MNVAIIATLMSFNSSFNRCNIEVLLKLGYKVHVIGSTSFHKSQDKIVEDFICYYDKKGVSFHFVKIPRSPIRFIKIYRSLKVVCKVLQDNKINFVHSHTPVGGLVGRLCSSKLSMKNIYTAHGFHFYKGSPIINWLLYFPVEFFLAKKSDAIITINTEDYKLARKMFRTKIYHVSGVGIQYNNYSSKAKSTDTNVLRIVSVGELNRNKNHISVINALSTIQFPYEFNIAGEGPLRKKIMKIIEIQNTSGSIHLLGHVNHINIILQNSDLFIMPSLREGLPVSIMEAMASGLPVVASNIRGIRDLVDEGRGGFLYNPSDKRHLLRLMTVLANDHQLRNSMGSYNRNRALQFDFENINKEMEKIYSEIFR